MKPLPLIIRLILTGMLSMITLKSYATDNLCAGEKLPETPGVTLTCAVTLGIRPDTGIDLSGTVNASMPTNSGIFFPKGEYLINHDMILQTGNHLVGSKEGVTIFRDTSANKTALIGNDNYNSAVNKITIKDIIFNNIAVSFYGNKKEISIINNVFINTASEDPQLFVSHNDFLISGNIFLRDENHPGLGISTYRNINSLIEHNIVGDITDSTILSTLNYLDSGTFDLIGKIKKSATEGKLELNNEQGNFISAWYATDGLRSSKFSKNIISGNKKICLKKEESTDKCLILRDHASYIKQYNNIEVTQNYYKGWPDDTMGASGAVKFRNASYLFFAGNYLDAVSFNARPYSTSAMLNMDNTFIFNNVINEAIISYWQEFTDTDTQYIDARNFVVLNNIFNSTNQNIDRIGTSWRSTHGEYLEYNNKYTDNTPVKTSNFKHVDQSTAEERFPAEKKPLLKIKALPLWREAGQITGPNLKENQLVRLDIHIGERPSQFVVYTPENRDYLPAYRWAAGLTKAFNAKISGACAGGLTTKISTDNECKFMASIGSNHLNKIYTTQGESASYTTRIMDKYRETGHISGTKLLPGQSVIFTVMFEDGSHEELVYKAESDYWREAHRWPSALAQEINNTIPGLCAGKYAPVTDGPQAGGKCELTSPTASSYLNKIYTVNGQSAVVTFNIISE